MNVCAVTTTDDMHAVAASVVLCPSTVTLLMATDKFWPKSQTNTTKDNKKLQLMQFSAYV